MLHVAAIIIADYPKLVLGGNHEKNLALSKFIQSSIVDCGISRDYVKVFNMRDENYDGLNNYKSETHIFLNTTYSTEQKSIEDVQLSGEVKTLHVLPKNNRAPIEVLDDNEIVIASFDKDFKNIFVYIDVADDEIWLQEVLRLVFSTYKQQPNPYSWKSGNLEAIKEQIKERIIDISQNTLRDLESKERHYMNSIEDYMKQISRNHRALQSVQLQIDGLKSKPNNMLDSLIADIDLLVNHAKIEDVEYKDSVFHLHTIELTMFDGIKEYWLGKMRIEVYLEETMIRFYSKEGGNKGYWTDNDPHPHVNGRDGRACLGNVADTIAELCAQNQLYALGLTAIDFLESVNTHDVAGKKVVNWETVERRTRRLNGEILEDEIDEDSEIFYCTCCEGDADETFIVYESAEDGATSQLQLSELTRVCEDCRDEHYVYMDSVDAYLPDCYRECEETNAVYHEDNMVTVYTDIHENGTPNYNSELQVCQDYCNDNFTYWESIGEYISDEFSEDDYFGDEEDEE